MSDGTKIEWAANADGSPGATWNPIRARNRDTGAVGWFCVHASDGCKGCYAETFNRRLGTGVDYKAIRDQCAAAGVAFFFKQWGEWVCEEQSPPDATFPGTGRDCFNDGSYWARLGKANAGRLLDGVEHNARPPIKGD